MFADGVLVSQSMVTKLIESASVDQVIAVGTMKEEPKVTVLSAKTPALRHLEKRREIQR